MLQLACHPGGNRRSLACWSGTLDPPFEAALKEGLDVGLDLSREEREFHQLRMGLVLLFHS